MNVERCHFSGTGRKLDLGDLRRTFSIVRIGSLRIIGDPCSRVGAAVGWSFGYAQVVEKSTISAHGFGFRFTEVDHIGFASAELHLILRSGCRTGLWLGVRRVWWFLSPFEFPPRTIVQVAVEWGSNF